MSRQNPSLPNNHHIIIGASGSGKSSFLRKRVKMTKAAAPRILIWDPDEDYKLPRVRDKRTLLALAKKSGFGAIRAAVTLEPNEENFEWFAQLCFAIAHAAHPLVVVCEEIADVTRVSKASPHWGQLCRKGRKYGVSIYAVTQRPQESDKTIFNQAKYKWCGALGSLTAYKFMAGEMDLPLEQLKALNNVEGKQVEYWIREATAAARKEKITFR